MCSEPVLEPVHTAGMCRRKSVLQEVSFSRAHLFNILCSEILITLGCASRKKILLGLRKPENYITYNPFHVFNVLIRLLGRNPLKVAREKLSEMFRHLQESASQMPAVEMENSFFLWLQLSCCLP